MLKSTPEGVQVTRIAGSDTLVSHRAERSCVMLIRTDLSIPKHSVCSSLLKEDGELVTDGAYIDVMNPHELYCTSYASYRVTNRVKPECL